VVAVSLTRLDIPDLIRRHGIASRAMRVE